MKSKPLFRWTHAAHTVRERMDLAVKIQTIFYMFVAEGLSLEEIRRNHPLIIEALVIEMRNTGIAVDQPAWFSNLFR